MTLKHRLYLLWAPAMFIVFAVSLSLGLRQIQQERQMQQRSLYLAQLSFAQQHLNDTVERAHRALRNTLESAAFIQFANSMDRTANRKSLLRQQFLRTFQRQWDPALPLRSLQILDGAQHPLIQIQAEPNGSLSLPFNASPEPMANIDGRAHRRLNAEPLIKFDSQSDSLLLQLSLAFHPALDSGDSNILKSHFSLLQAEIALPLSTLEQMLPTPQQRIIMTLPELTPLPMPAGTVDVHYDAAQLQLVMEGSGYLLQFDAKAMHTIDPWLLSWAPWALITILLSIIVMAWLTQRWLVAPIIQLTHRVEHADKSPQALQAFSSNDEIGTLNQAYLTLLEKQHELTMHDPITGLLNRFGFQQQLFTNSQRSLDSGVPYLLMQIVLGKFSFQNDAHGSALADALLGDIGKQLTRLCEHHQVAEPGLARTGGTEFGLVLSGAQCQQLAEPLCREIIALFESGYRFKQRQYNLLCAIGMAEFPTNATTPATLNQCANIATTQALALGYSHAQKFNNQHVKSREEHKQIESALLEALDSEQFELYYMPYVETQQNGIAGVEILLRSEHPVLKQAGPGVFIPIAEQTGLARRIDFWVLERAMTQVAALQRLHTSQLVISINVSASVMLENGFSLHCSALMQHHQVAPELIELELTETQLAPDSDVAAARLQELRALGLAIALDDFGTGYTSLAQLGALPISKLKVDQLFVERMEHSSLDAELIRMLVRLGKNYGYRSTLEGVETVSQSRVAKHLGFDYEQGYLHAKPMNWEQLVQFFSHEQKVEA
ncbi:putative bifunctional diguanylate cyclase/phosphodiesterase [Ferrimonas pelagia]|uniref:Uncharacterized protein n=1 Tax=Ferrimonas pelagia TaxID=1177826 RepID=A0ABP9FNA9_9GAMM